MAHTTATKPRTPDAALQELLWGNDRFASRQPRRRDYLAEVDATAGGQKPFAAVLSCIDSRVPVETVLDQGIGDIFSARVAGNVVNDDVVGSLEFATQVAGACLVLVMGHTRCGAVDGACARVQLGKLTGLLGRLRPAVDHAARMSTASSPAEDFVDRVAKNNVAVSVDALRTQSPLLAGLESAGKLRIVGAMYDVASGRVSVLETSQTSPGRSIH